MKETTSATETAVLIGVSHHQQDLVKVEEYLEELAFLVETADGIPVKKFIQKLEYPDPRTYVGKGKLEEIRIYIEQHETDIAIFDDELSPSQIRNIERELKCRILDRNNLILDIFAKRARTAGSANASTIALLSLTMISRGVPLGAKNPNHPDV